MTSSDKKKPEPGEQQSDATTESNKPDYARAKGDTKAGNILGGVQPDDKND